MNAPPSAIRGYEDKQISNPQVETRRRSSDTGSCWCEIQNWAILLTLCHLCGGGTVFLIYSTLIFGATSELRTSGQRQNQDIAGNYGIFLGFGLGISSFMTAASVMLLIAQVKKNRQYSFIFHTIGWILLLFFSIGFSPLHLASYNVKPIVSTDVNTTVYSICLVFFIIKIVESIIFNKQLKDLENNDDDCIGVQCKYLAQVRPTTN